jgi:hypothetical protein
LADRNAAQRFSSTAQVQLAAYQPPSSRTGPSPERSFSSETPQRYRNGDDQQERTAAVLLLDVAVGKRGGVRRG